MEEGQPKERLIDFKLFNDERRKQGVNFLKEIKQSIAEGDSRKANDFIDQYIKTTLNTPQLSKEDKVKLAESERYAAVNNKLNAKSVTAEGKELDTKFMNSRVKRALTTEQLFQE
jgi:hypothetical protein